MRAADWKMIRRAITLAASSAQYDERLKEADRWFALLERVRKFEAGYEGLKASALEMRDTLAELGRIVRRLKGAAQRLDTPSRPKAGEARAGSIKFNCQLDKPSNK